MTAVKESSDSVRTAILLALEYLSKVSSVDVHKSGALEFLLWKATSEAEYAAFRLSMMERLSDYHFKIKLASGADSPELDWMQARKLIEEAETALNSDPKLAYTDLRTAIGYLRRGQSSGLGTKSRQEAR